MINQLIKEAHQNSIAKGFYENGKGLNIGEKIALMHSELSEALEADRKNRYCEIDLSINNIEDDSNFVKYYSEYIKGTFQEEMADVVIRVMDLCGLKNIDLEQHIIAKMRYNKNREKYHGKKY